MTPIIRSIDLCVYVVVFCTLVSPGGREEGGGVHITCAHY